MTDITAIIAEEAARLCRLPRDNAYTYGLLHNLGTLGLMSAFPSEYLNMLEVSNENGYDLLKTERDLFEIDHCAAGAYMAQDWDFPDELAAAISAADYTGKITLTPRPDEIGFIEFTYRVTDDPALDAAANTTLNNRVRIKVVGSIPIFGSIFCIRCKKCHAIAPPRSDGGRDFTLRPVPP